MALTANFGTKVIDQPGVYVQVRGETTLTNPPNVSGNIVIIDTGTMAGWGGAGIAGTLSNGLNAITQHSDLASLRSFLRGGPWWVLAEALFRPDGIGSSGASSVFVAHARATTPASLAITLTNGSFTLQARREGLGGNATIASTKLQKGFGLTLAAGIVNTSAYILKMWEGTYHGAHTDGSDLDGVSATNSPAKLIVQSTEVTTVPALLAWMANDATFQTYFNVSASAGTGNIVAGDLSTFSTMQGFSGGTETYNAADVDTVLDYLDDIPFGIILTDQNEANAAGTANLKMLAYLVEEARFPALLIAGGSSSATNFATQSLAAAATLNSDRAVLVNGGIIRPFGTISSPRTWNSMHKAAFVAGRLAGLPVQVPLTFKGLDIKGEQHSMTSGQISQALKAGVCYTKRDADLSTQTRPRFIVGQGITTLQLNTSLFTTDGKSFSIQAVRILGQLLRDMTIAAKTDLFSTETGPNRNNPSQTDVLEWSKGFLQTNTVQNGVDNLLLKYGNFSISTVGDAYYLSFECEINNEINKLLITTYITNR